MTVFLVSISNVSGNNLVVESLVVALRALHIVDGAVKGCQMLEERGLQSCFVIAKLAFPRHFLFK